MGRLDLKRHPGQSHLFDAEDENIQHTAHVAQPGVGLEDETVGQEFGGQLDRHPHLKHVVGNLQLALKCGISNSGDTVVSVVMMIMIHSRKETRPNSLWRVWNLTLR